MYVALREVPPLGECVKGKGKIFLCRVPRSSTHLPPTNHEHLLRTNKAAGPDGASTRLLKLPVWELGQDINLFLHRGKKGPAKKDI